VISNSEADFDLESVFLCGKSSQDPPVQLNGVARIKKWQLLGFIKLLQERVGSLASMAI
jgi:hypothetical protein